MANLMVVSKFSTEVSDLIGVDGVLSDFLDKSLYEELGRQAIESYGLTNFLNQDSKSFCVTDLVVDRVELQNFLQRRIHKGRRSRFATSLEDYALVYLMGNRSGYKVEEPYTVESIEQYFKNDESLLAYEEGRLNEGFARALYTDLVRSFNNYLSKAKGPHLSVLKFVIDANNPANNSPFISIASSSAAVKLAGGAELFADKAKAFYQESIDEVGESLGPDTLLANLDLFMIQTAQYSEARTIRSFAIDELMQPGTEEGVDILKLASSYYKEATPSCMKTALFTDEPDITRERYSYARRQLGLMMLRHAYKSYMQYIQSGE